MKRALFLGLSCAAFALFVNAETANADHCHSGYGRGYSSYGYSVPYRYSNYRYSTPYYNSYYSPGYRYYGNSRYGHSHYGHSHGYGRPSGLYIQGRNFGLGIRY